MEAIPAKIDLREHPLPAGTKKAKRQHNAPAYDLQSQCYRVFGVDLIQIPGFDGPTAQVMLTEVGPDLSKFSSGSAFANWLTLCPNNVITGGKILSAKTRKGKAGPRWPCVRQRRLWNEATTAWGRSSGGCGPELVAQRRSPPWRTNWHGSTTPWFVRGRPMTNPSWPRRILGNENGRRPSFAARLARLAFSSWPWNLLRRKHAPAAVKFIRSRQDAKSTTAASGRVDSTGRLDR
jgi:hypothetical protein